MDDFLHRLVITRAADYGPSGQDPVTGQPPGDAQNRDIYDGAADVQDAGESRPFGASGMPLLNADATVFFPEGQREALLSAEPNDAVTVYYPDSDRIAEGEVLVVRELDDVILLRYR